MDGEDFSTDEIFLVVDGVNIEEERARVEKEVMDDWHASQLEELRLAREEAIQLLGTWTGYALANQQSFEMNVNGLG